MNRKFIENSNKILRKILNSNNCLDILKNIVESFLNIKIEKIQINQSPEIENKNSKIYGIVDMRVTTNNEELNVGIQIIDGDYIQNKMFLYYAKIHSNQIFYNDGRKIARTATINILDLPFFSSNRYHKIIKIKTNLINDNILETMELHVIELPKFNKILNNESSDEKLWTAYLKGDSIEKIDFAKNKNPQINKLDSLLEEYWQKEII